MNERIRELAKQAGAHWREGYVEQPNGDSVWKDKAKVDIVDMDLEKFAELIVRECSQFVEDKFDFCGDEIIIAEKILEHFGVEE